MECTNTVNLRYNGLRADRLSVIVDDRCNRVKGYLWKYTIGYIAKYMQ
jgi:hypothetical protein